MLSLLAEYSFYGLNFKKWFDENCDGHTLPLSPVEMMPCRLRTAIFLLIHKSVAFLLDHHPFVRAHTEHSATPHSAL